MPNDSESVNTSMRILVVEDIPMEAELLQRALMIFKSILGEPEIIITNTFAAALEFVQGVRIADIVILDPTLTDRRMEETIRDIAKIEDRAPTFILTGHQKHVVEKLLREAGSGHIPVVEKGPAVFEKGFLTGICSTVIAVWHAKRHRPLREALQILEGFRRESA